MLGSLNRVQRAIRKFAGMRNVLLNRAELACELGISERTLERWNAAKNGPTKIKIGRKVYYRRTSVLAWLAGCQQSLSWIKRAIAICNATKTRTQREARTLNSAQEVKAQAFEMKRKPPIPKQSDQLKAKCDAEN